MGKECSHMDQINNVKPNTDGCEECMKEGKKWVQVRMCMVCGHVGCCDSSDGKHARKHFEETGHAIIHSYEAGTDWKWCYEDNTYIQE